MIKEQIEKTLLETLKQHAQQLNLPENNGVQNLLNIERPRQGSFGDYAVNVSPLARYAKMAPPQIAAIIAQGFSHSDWAPSVAGGFINFQVNETKLLNSMVRLIQQEKPGENNAYADTRCLLEFVSANPTGPLHIGHGRWVALGDSLARIMRHCGADVTNEFYINDAGSQVFNLANSMWYRCLEILGTGGKLPPPEEGKPYPFYPGEYVVDLAQGFLNEHKAQVLAWDNPEHTAPPEAIEALAAYGKAEVLTQQKALIERCRLHFDNWFSEKALHEQNAVKNMIQTLKDKGVTYEKDGALWFASSRFGDDQDRVLIKSDGSYTYLTADIAYHDEKYRRRDGYYNLIMNIWGADHHGYIPRMKAAMQALDHNPDQLEIILGQLVNLIVEGERTRMGKRKKMLTLEELVDEVWVDAVRFWMVSKSQDTPLDFNVDLAATASEENPVFYVQYAHARCASILRNAFQPRLDTTSGEELPPVVTVDQWDAFLKELSPEALAPLFDRLDDDQARSALKELLLKMDSFEDRAVDTARQRAPHMIARYALDLSADFHHFYNVCRILLPDAELSKVRLTVIYTLKKVLAQALDLLGVSAPEQM
jgi:arginyl-tRNA synthetase